MGKVYDAKTRISILAIFAKYSRNIMVVKAKDFTSIYNECKDIDIISSFSEEEFENILVSHGLGFKKRKYYNRNEYIVYKEKWDVVSIDFLFTLSRKGSVIEYSWAEELESARVHDGITYASKNLMFSYASMFYKLNGVDVPSHYTDETIGLKAYRWSLLQYSKYFLYSLWRVLGNCRRNYRLTFSGPDGSGKTTFIEASLSYLELGFGRQVYYQRHRPFILPMLARYRGKDAAYDSGINAPIRASQPATGLSMTVRYLYYWIDYQLGSIVDFFRYGVFGRIVIYDRFYFDFICDPERSNLSKSISASWFFKKTLKRPKLNVLIEVEPEIALNRKDELTRSEYNLLYERYVSLWDELRMEKVDNNEGQEKTMKAMKTLLFDYL